MGLADINPNDRIRGAADIPLTSEGRQQVAELAQQLKDRGGLHSIMSDNLSRTQDTGKAISAATGAIHTVNPQLRDINYGIYTGAYSRDAVPVINRFIRDMPHMALPQGESFNQYKQRMLPIVGEAMQRLEADPTQKIGLILNRRSTRTVDGWLRAGAKPTLETDPDVVTGFVKDEPPGNIYRVAKGETGKWGMTKIDAGAKSPLDGGIYLIRHGLTAWNGESFKGK